MRTFIAANLTDTLKAALSQVQEALKARGADVGWVKPENLHITLKFLGEVEEARLPVLSEAIASSLRGTSPFPLALGGLGAFPDLRFPRVIWIGVKRGAKELSALQARLEEGLQRIGFSPEDRPFSPHLTLGRVRSPRGRGALVEGLKALEVPILGEMILESVDLMRSQLHPTGAIYTIIQSFPLERQGLDVRC